MEWQPIETAIEGKLVLLIGGGWRHAFPGMVCGEFGMCWLDSPNPDIEVPYYHATHWMPLPEPPTAPLTLDAKSIRAREMLDKVLTAPPTPPEG